MSKQLSKISTTLKTFIEAQKIFFVATADVDGRINLSPKGMDAIRVLDENRVIWLNLTGSGNETAAHLLGVNRMTIMFCSFEGAPLILRLYGTAECRGYGSTAFEALKEQFPNYSGQRQIFDMQVEMVQTSCGFAVPEYEYKGQRDLLSKWSDKKSQAEMQAYWQEKNALSIDGKPTGII